VDGANIVWGSAADDPSFIVWGNLQGVETTTGFVLLSSGGRF